MILRGYQVRALDGLRDALRRGKRRPLLVSPTGSGKTVTAAELVKSAESKGSKILFLAHRKELIDQCSAKLDAFGVNHGVIMAGHWRRFDFLPVQVASVQTLARRLERRPDADLIILDEAHHARAGTYGRILELYPRAPVVGLTATPWRTDGKGLGEVFDELVVAATPAELIAQGHLVHYGGFSFELPDLSGVKVKRGDYDEGQLEMACSGTRIIGGVVEHWLEHAAGARTIAFAVTCEHSRKIVQKFREAGVPAEHLDGTTPKLEREAILARLESGETQVLSNVGVLTEGWDCPAAACCILARPTKSLGLYLQMVGRVMRPHPTKARALIHDHAGCLLEHGLPDEERDYALDADPKEKRNQAPSVIQCQQCARIFPAGDERCPECGWENARLAKERSEAAEREIAEVQGRMLAIEEIRRMRTVAERTKAAEFKRLLEVAERKGYKRGWAYYRFRSEFGEEPRFRLDLLAEIPAATAPVIDLRKLSALKAQLGETA